MRSEPQRATVATAFKFRVKGNAFHMKLAGSSDRSCGEIVRRSWRPRPGRPTIGAARNLYISFMSG